jgi:hypothetical protein
MKKSYSIFLEYVRDDCISVLANNCDEAMALAEERAEKNLHDGEIVRVVGFALDAESEI